jgi:hypothetical protein
MDKHPGSAALTVWPESLSWAVYQEGVQRRRHHGRAGGLAAPQQSHRSHNHKHTPSQQIRGSGTIEYKLDRSRFFRFWIYHCFSQTKNQKFFSFNFFLFFCCGLYSFIILYNQIVWYQVLLIKGTGSRERIQISGQKFTVLVTNKSFSWFSNVQNALLMRCRHCHFPRGLGENISEN